MIEQDLLAKLRIISASGVFAFTIPSSGSFPCITYQPTGNKKYRTISGSSSLQQTSFQIDCWGTTYASMKSLAGSVINLLETNQTSWEMSWVSDTFDLMENETGLFREVINLEILNK